MMHLGRFHAVVYDLAHHFQEADPPAKLEQCAAHLDQYASSRSTAHLDSFRQAIAEFYDAAAIADPDLMQPYAQQVIAELSLDGALTPRLTETVAKAIAEKSFDPSGLASELRQIGARVAKKIAQINAIDTAFTGLDVEFERVEKTAAEVGFLLPREIVGDTLKDLTTEFSSLGKLVRAVNELVGADDYDPRVVTISSSWWQVFLDLDPNQILVWVLAIERIVNLFKSNLEIKNLQRQLKDKDIPAEITELIEREVQRRVSSAVRELAAEIRRDHGKIDDEARLNEVETQLRQGLFYLARRMNEGAQVEINVGVPDPPKEQKPEAGEQTPEVAAQIAAARERITELRSIRKRARAASVETIALDRSTPLMLADDTQSSEGSPKRDA